MYNTYIDGRPSKKNYRGRRSLEIIIVIIIIMEYSPTHRRNAECATFAKSRLSVLNQRCFRWAHTGRRKNARCLWTDRPSAALQDALEVAVSRTLDVYACSNVKSSTFLTLIDKRFWYKKNVLFSASQFHIRFNHLNVCKSKRNYTHYNTSAR